MAGNGEVKTVKTNKTVETVETVDSIIHKHLHSVIQSEDTELYGIFLKVYPFITGSDICEPAVRDVECDTEEGIVALRFLVYAFENGLADKTRFNIGVIQEKFTRNSFLVSKLSQTASARPIQFSMSDLTGVANVRNFNLMQTDSRLIAEKWSYICSNYFVRIKPHEIVRYIRDGTNRVGILNVPECRNIARLIDIFNNISAWVPTTILRHPKPKHQEKLIKKFIEIAIECRILRNYHALMAIYAGLGNTAIARLEYLWKKQKYNKRLKDLGQLLTPENNYKEYRAELETVVLCNTDKTEGRRGEMRDIAKCIPCMPYLGVIVHDFQHMMEAEFVDVGEGRLNPSTIETTLILVNRFLKTQVQYDAKCNADIDVVFDKLIIWSDERLYDTSRALYMPKSRTDALHKAKSLDTVKRKEKEDKKSEIAIDGADDVGTGTDTVAANAEDDMSEVSVVSNDTTSSSGGSSSDPKRRSRSGRRSRGAAELSGVVSLAEFDEMVTNGRSRSMTMAGIDRQLIARAAASAAVNGAAIPAANSAVSSDTRQRATQRRDTQRRATLRRATIRGTRSSAAGGQEGRGQGQVRPADSV